MRFLPKASPLMNAQNTTTCVVARFVVEMAVRWTRDSFDWQCSPNPQRKDFQNRSSKKFEAIKA